MSWFQQNAPQSSGIMAGPRNPNDMYRDAVLSQGRPTQQSLDAQYAGSDVLGQTRMPLSEAQRQYEQYANGTAPDRSIAGAMGTARDGNQTGARAVMPQGSPQTGGNGSEDAQAVFTELMAGKPITLETMQAIEPELRRRTGAQLEYNARRNAADLKLASGQMVDVVRGFEGPMSERALQWDAGTGGGGMPNGYSLNGANNLASFSAPGLAAPWTQQFQAPTPQDLENDPYYQWIREQGREGIQKSAASRGTLLTGGTLKDLTQFEQGAASSQLDKMYGRQLGEYQMNQGTYYQNQNNAYNRLSGLATTGQQAASSYAANVGNLAQQNGALAAQNTGLQNQSNQQMGNTFADLVTLAGNAYNNRNKAKAKLPGTTLAALDNPTGYDVGL